ncbi:hypothetical protein EMPS_01533 [Entomortierella parvispora]|uniref:F-box domain-containing protein n=1 Tax=Entomortierella parvispora TaxID=205924 RepID=A0A9P3LSW2_9FUNG|nr:hypothetical protein EMPS_01533 [Entomortierella parvispora]
MVRLGRNQSLPAPPSHGATMRKATTNVFSFPTLTLTRTSSNSSSIGGFEGSASRSSSKSRATSRSRSSSAAPIPLAPIISAIQRGNFVMLSDMDLDALIKDMMGKNSKVIEALNITAASVSAADAKILAKLIKSSDAANIKSLRMEGNTISQQASKLMFEAWKFNKTISTLSLARSGVNDKTVKYLARVIAKNETLKVLDLSSNHITAQGVEYLAEAIVLNRAVTRLCLQSNNIKKAGAPHLAKILSKNRVIRHLNIGSNSLGADGIAHVAEAVRFNRTLNSLSLDMNEMGYKGAAAIAAALISNRHLTHLYLPHNNIGDRGMADICESLKRNRYLISLDLELNHIGQGQSVVGLKALGDVLKVNTSLREINLSFNVFASEAIQELTPGMVMNTTLESVLFTNCGLSTDAALSLAKVLSSATGLQNLGLTNNPEIGVDGYWALASSLIKNRSLKGIQLDYNSEDRQQLYDSFQNSLTRNHIWQQAIYAAACRILILSRIVLLGRPANQKQLQSQQEHHIQHHNQHHGWNIFRRVKLGRSNSSNSIASLWSLGKSNNGQSHSSNAADGGGAPEDQIGANFCHGNSHSRQILAPVGSALIGQRGATRQPSNSSLLSGNGVGSNAGESSNTANNSHGSASRHAVQNSATTLVELQHSTHPLHSSHYQPRNTLHHQHTLSAASTVVPGAIEYNPHKILANLGNMPYEIFENICAFLDPGRTMSIAQVRATVQAADDRTTLVRYYTRERMLERIFNSRYISPVGTRYSLKPGDERI